MAAKMERKTAHQGTQGKKGKAGGAGTSRAVEAAERLVKWVRRNKPLFTSTPESLALLYPRGIQPALEGILETARQQEGTDVAALAGWLTMLVYEMSDAGFNEGYMRGHLDCLKVKRTQGQGGGPRDKDGRRRMRREYVAQKCFVERRSAYSVTRIVALIDGEPEEVVTEQRDSALQKKYEGIVRRDQDYIKKNLHEFSIDSPRPARFIPD